VFHMVPKTHAGHMKAVKNLILDGTSKWLAKIFITGKDNWFVSLVICTVMFVEACWLYTKSCLLNVFGLRKKWSHPAICKFVPCSCERSTSNFMIALTTNKIEALVANERRVILILHSMSILWKPHINGPIF